jgi:hypothetical protein
MIVDGVKVKVRTKMPPTQKANDEIQRYSDVPVLSGYLESRSEQERGRQFGCSGYLEGHRYLSR